MVQRFGRLVLIVFVAAIVLVGLGYAWGASGRGALRDSLQTAQQQLDVADARAYLLEARVNLYNMNFGDASRKFEEAKTPLRRIRQRFVDERRDDAVRSLAAALEHVDEAQRLAGKLEPAANTKAGEALEAIKVATTH